jgi:hypothetical protein
MSLSDVINRGATDDVIGKMKVSALLAWLPGVGEARAEGDDSYRLRLWPRGPREDAALRKRWPGWDRYR